MYSNKAKRLSLAERRPEGRCSQSGIRVKHPKPVSHAMNLFQPKSLCAACVGLLSASLCLAGVALGQSAFAAGEDRGGSAER